jgi:hypothetical protein
MAKRRRQVTVEGRGATGAGRFPKEGSAAGREDGKVKRAEEDDLRRTTMGMNGRKEEAARKRREEETRMRRPLKLKIPDADGWWTTQKGGGGEGGRLGLRVVGR